MSLRGPGAELEGAINEPYHVLQNLEAQQGASLRWQMHYWLNVRDADV